MIVEKCGEFLRFDGAANFPPNAWTITFWVKGLPGADWNTAGADSTEFVQLFGPAGWTRFYKYQGHESIFLFSRHNEGKSEFKDEQLNMPTYPVDAWHFHSIVWRKGWGVDLYLDGTRIASARDQEAVEDISYFMIGQVFGANNQPRLIDEFTVFAGAMTADDVLREHLKEKGANPAVPLHASVMPFDFSIRYSPTRKALWALWDVPRSYMDLAGRILIVPEGSSNPLLTSDLETRMPARGTSLVDVTIEDHII
jgi:hypothetical protein